MSVWGHRPSTDGLGRRAVDATSAMRLGSLHLDFPRLVLALAVLALAAGTWSVDLWLVVALGLWALGRLAVGRAFPRLRFHLRLAHTHIFAGEWVQVAATVANPSWWPIPWVEVQSRQPEDLAGGVRRVEWLPGGAVRTLSVQWYAQRRGVYRVGGLTLRGGDWFGLYRGEREVAPTLDLVVYPRTWRIRLAPEVRRLPQGPRRDRSSPFEDELPAGLRPYRPGDPRRRIAWRATARHGTLLVREMPPVREVATCLFVDLNAGEWADRGLGPEQAVALAASLVCDPRLANRPVGVGTWAATAVKGVRGRAEDEPARALWLPPAAGSGGTVGGAGRRALLRLLAAVEPAPGPDPGPPFPDVLRLLGRRLPWGAQSIWLVPRDTPPLRALAAAWQARGHQVTLLCLERREGPAVARVGGTTLRAWEVEQRGGFEIR